MYFAYPGTASASEELVFLADRSPEDWERLLAYAELLRYNAGDLIIRAGDNDRALFIIVAGKLEVLLPTERGEFRRYSMIEPKSVTGEVAFVDGRPRTATVRAVTDGDLLRLSFESYEVLAARYPELGRAILLDLGRILAAKLRQASEVIAGTS
jgi:CRP/FNR family transcriptional regulator, cyclic AMP receptor protein